MVGSHDRRAVAESNEGSPASSGLPSHFVSKGFLSRNGRAN
jgi:hypothetical protein